MMNKIFLTTILSTTLIASISAMDITVPGLSSDQQQLAKEGYEAMKDVYSTMSTALKDNSFSMLNVDAYEDYLIKGHDAEKKKILGLTYFMHTGFLQTAQEKVETAQKVVTDKKDEMERCLKSTNDEDLKRFKIDNMLEQAEALLNFLNMISREQEANEIQQTVTYDPKKKYATLKATINQINDALRAREKAAASEKLKEEKERQREREKTAKEEAIKQAREVYNQPEYAALRVPLERLLQLIKVKWINGSLTRNDFATLTDYIRGTNNTGETGKADGITALASRVIELALVRFFSDGTLIQNAYDAYNNRPKGPPTPKEKEHFSAVVALLKYIRPKALELNETIQNTKLAHEVIESAEHSHFTTTVLNEGKLLEQLSKKERACAVASNENRAAAHTIHSKDVRMMAGSYGVPVVIDGAEEILFLGGTINNQVNTIDPAVEAQNPLIQSDLIDDLKLFLQDKKKKISAFIILDSSDAAATGVKPTWLSDLEAIVKPGAYKQGNCLTLLVSKTGSVISYRAYDNDNEYNIPPLKQDEITRFLLQTFYSPKKDTSASTSVKGAGTTTAAMSKSLLSKLFNWRVIAPVTCVIAGALGVFFWQKYGQKKPVAKKTA
jgi:hypothetical protein